MKSTSRDPTDPVTSAAPTSAAAAARLKASNPLQRGSACLSCRKRKMKCDATKPCCRQCIKANRADECEYDDGRLKSRTQILQEKIAKLEERIRELESSPDTTPTSISPSSSIHRLSSVPEEFSLPLIADTHSLNYSPDAFFEPPQFIEGSSKEQYPGLQQGFEWLDQAVIGNTSDFDSFTDSQSLGLRTPVHELDIIPPNVQINTANIPSPWNDPDEDTLPDRSMLLQYFLPHASQCGFEVNPQRLHATLNGTTDEPAHPALMNAIYLLGCHFSLDPLVMEHESSFLSKTLKGISIALEHSDRLVNIVQASALLAFYFFAKARLLEGYYHSSSSARLAVALGLHQIRTPYWQPAEALTPPISTWNGSPGSFVPLEPPKHPAELGERILAFWQVFVIDRCWSVATGLPSSLPDDDHPQLHICTVWPRPVMDYEANNMLNMDNTSLASLTNPPPMGYPINSCTQTLRAKAATFFERASRIASVRDQTSQWNQIMSMEFAVSNFAATLPSFYVSTPTFDPTMSLPRMTTLLDLDLAVVHTLTYICTIQLYHGIAQKERRAQEKCLMAARSVTAIIRQFVDYQYSCLDPIIGTCWMCASDVFIRESTAGAPQIPEDCILGYSMKDELDSLVSALRRLGETFPVAYYQAEKVENSRNASGCR